MTGKEKGWLQRTVKMLLDQKGLGLVETLVAVAILGTSVVAFVVALSTGSIAVGQQNEEVVAQRLAQAQLEDIKSQAYDTEASTYPTIVSPDGYTISVVVSAVPSADADIQKITVDILHGSESIITVEDYKVNR